MDLQRAKDIIHTLSEGVDPTTGEVLSADHICNRTEIICALLIAEQEKLCAELQRRGCDIGRTTYAKYEAGELNIRASVIIELRKIYKCSYEEFFIGLEREP